MPDRALRLGDVLDDYCPRCRLLLNHDVVTMTGGKVDKTTCRTCYNTHDYRNALVPARRNKAKKDDAKTLMSQVLESMPLPQASPLPPPVPVKKRRDLWADVERLKKK
jgi:hypothetical protein